MTKKNAERNGSHPTAVVEETASEKKRISQSDIPAYSLEEALRVPQAIADNYNLKPTTSLKVASALKIGPSTGTFRMITGAAVAYGVTSGGGQAPQIEVTPLGARIVRPKKEGDDMAAKREAFLKPRVIGTFLRQCDGGAVPRRDLAINILSDDMAVPRPRAEDVLDMILDGARTLGFVENINGKEYIALEGAGIAAVEDDGGHESSEAVGTSEGEEILETPPKLPASVVRLPVISSTVHDTNKRVFITHGKNKDFLEPIKKLITYGKYEPVVAEEKQSVSKPVPDRVMGLMRSCGAAIIHVDVERSIEDKDGKEHIILNPNVLIEIGAAMAL
jgi:hypothetical protein